jgi:hypothetical protein
MGNWVGFLHFVDNLIKPYQHTVYLSDLRSRLLAA